MNQRNIAKISDNTLDEKCKELSERMDGLVTTCSDANQTVESKITEATTNVETKFSDTSQKVKETQKKLDEQISIIQACCEETIN